MRSGSAPQAEGQGPWTSCFKKSGTDTPGNKDSEMDNSVLNSRSECVKLDKKIQEGKVSNKGEAKQENF